MTAASSPKHDPGRGQPHRHIAPERRILAALLLTLASMVVEVAGGILAGSLALLSDAGHMNTYWALAVPPVARNPNATAEINCRILIPLLPVAPLTLGFLPGQVNIYPH